MMEQLWELITVYITEDGERSCLTYYFSTKEEVVSVLEESVLAYTGLEQLPEEANFPGYGINKERTRGWVHTAKSEIDWYVEYIGVDTPLISEGSRMGLDRDNVQVALLNIGEGIHGDYNPDYWDDINLLRVDIFHYNGEAWEPVDNGSFCTNIAAYSVRALLDQYLKEIMDKVYEPVMSGASIKHICEEFSYLG